MGNMTERKMRNYYEQWQQSDLSKSAFAAQHQINRSTFYYWTRRLSAMASDETVNEAKVGFDLIHESAEHNSSHPSAIVRFPSGVSLECYHMPEISFIKALLH